MINNSDCNIVRPYKSLFPVKKLDKEIFSALEAEREEMSYILHEDIAQLISIAKMGLSGDTANEANTYLALALKKVRQLAFEIKPQVLDQFDLAEVLQVLLMQRLKSEINFKKVHKHNIPKNMDCLMETAIFRLVQQILNVVASIDHSQFAITIARSAHLITLKTSFVVSTIGETEERELENALTKAAQAFEHCFKGHHDFQLLPTGKVIFSVCLDER